MPTTIPQKSQILIVGGGSSGGVLGILLSELGFDVSLVDTRDPTLPFLPDSRAFALVRGAWRVLEAAGVAQKLIDEAEPLLSMEAHDANGVLPPAASLFGVDDLPDSDRGEPLGYMIEVDLLNNAIRERVQQCEAIKLYAPNSVTALATGPDCARVTLDDGTELQADLVIGADGVGSAIRDLAGIRTIGWSYEQAVVAVTLQLDQPHHGAARQWFQEEGPFAVLPLTENRGNLAWFRNEAAGLATAKLSREELEAEINGRFGHLAGPMKVLRDPLAYPLRLRLAETLIADRVALVGDAVRRVNPLAGQGFNLGLKDIAALVEILCESRKLGLSLADGSRLETYQQWRRFDGVSTALAMDGINRAFSNSNPLLTPFKRLALSAGTAIAPLRRALAAQASADQPGLPALVRGQPLSALG
ncbi:MAG: 2-octaprenyl-3-methyl-6-methoxy-1,4-benzoquinol hydroxylase [Ponticaulis sp.]|nr:2-octaprenyl-3-methyl-6-methoxy-1,4-benzoquinol hydroxylase [Ponticaulis sp.]